MVSLKSLVKQNIDSDDFRSRFSTKCPLWIKEPICNSATSIATDISEKSM